MRDMNSAALTDTATTTVSAARAATRAWSERWDVEIDERDDDAGAEESDAFGLWLDGLYAALGRHPNGDDVAEALATDEAVEWAAARAAGEGSL